MRHVLSSSFFALTVPALAQTYIVDANNGPGTNFTSIAAAVAAVPDGAVLRVRQGPYSAFSILNKSLKVLADPGVVVTHGSAGGVAAFVGGLQADKSVVLSGLEVTPPHLTASVRVVVDQCAGSVLLDRVAITSTATAALEATGCDRLLIRDLSHSSFLRCTFTSCNTVAEGSTLGVGPVVPGLVPGSAVLVTGGTLQLIDCGVSAALAFPPFPAHAIELQGGELRLLGNTTLTGGFGSPAFAVGGTGTVRVARTVTLSAPPFAPGVTATSIVMPTVTAAFAAGQATASVAAVPGHLALLAVALPGPLVSLPGLDAIWLDGATFTPLGLGVLGTSPLVAQMPWTSGPQPGVRALFQAMTFDPAMGVAISNPSFVILP